MRIEDSEWFRELGTPDWPGNHIRELRGERTFRIPLAEAPGVVADAVHATTHFLLTDSRAD
jgi:hypothetical protein